MFVFVRFVFFINTLFFFAYSGLYDQAYLDYVVQLLKKCQDYQLHVYIDPHQDSASTHLKN